MRKEWELRKIGECFSYIKNGANIKQTKGAGGYPITRIETLSGGVFNRDRLGYADVVDLEQYKDYILESGDLLVSHINSKTYIGRTVVYEGKQGENIIHGMNLLRLKHNRSLINSAFLCYYTQSVSFKLDIMRIRKDAVNQSSFTISDFKKIRIPVPVLATQLSIVSELDKLNELIQIKKEQLKDYDALAQSIFYEMFGDPVENEKGWEVKKLKDISRKIGDGLHGTPEYSELDTGWYFINGNNLENGCISIKSTTKKVTDFVRKKYYVEMDDFTLLVSINGTLGKSAFYNGENVILGKSACYIKLNKDVNKLFIYEIIRGEYFKRYAESVCTGTTIRNVSLKAMREFPIIYPPLPLQQSFAQKIEQIEQQKAAIQKTITDLETLLAARMQYWFD